MGALAYTWCSRHDQQHLRVSIYALCDFLELLAHLDPGHWKEYELQRADDGCRGWV